ncbi:MAG TPA: TRAP transporter small permease [Geminicoccaceae bacterium]|nr:TRAP transporter small permease [Geminicoccaceae bacterium]
MADRPRPRVRSLVVTSPTHALARPASWIFLAAVLVTAYEVMVRYLFNAPTIWAHELTILLCAIGYFLAGPVTLAERRHIAITLLYDRTSGRLRRLLDIVRALVMAFYFGALAWAVHRRAWSSLTGWEGTGTAWNAPIPALLMPLILITALFMFAQTLVNLRAELRR